MGTVRIQVKIPVEWAAELSVRAKGSGSTVSEEVRRILGVGLGTVGAEAGLALVALAAKKPASSVAGAQSESVEKPTAPKPDSVCARMDAEISDNVDKLFKRAADRGKPHKWDFGHAACYEVDVAHKDCSGCCYCAGKK